VKDLNDNYLLVILNDSEESRINFGIRVKNNLGEFRAIKKPYPAVDCGCDEIDLAHCLSYTGLRGEEHPEEQKSENPGYFHLRGYHILRAF
jgi:hypothetical protein